MIEVSGLTRNYGDFVAVNDVSFSIPKGQIVGLLGHNGAGKTTIMKVLTGYLEPTSGQVSIDGLDIVASRIDAQKKIGYLPEHSPLYPEMPVVEYLDYVCELRGISQESRGAAIRQAVERTGLEEKAFNRVNTLSKGYLQRVGVAQAIIHSPEILILDEATSGLDPSQIHGMRDLIQELSKDATVILSTHIMQEVEAVCDRAIIISRGKISADSPLADLQSSDRIVVSCSGGDLVGLLKGVSGVAGVEVLPSEGGTMRAQVSVRGDLAATSAAIAQVVMNDKRELYHLGVEERSLETVFREIENQVAAGGVND